MKFKEHVKYKIQPQKDGTYVVLQKDLGSKKVDIHSHHDTYEEAKDELDSLYSKPSQAETMKMIRDLRFSMDAIKN
jgi:hypothetical protein